MTHFIILVVIPKKIYLQGELAVKQYIQKVMAPYDETLEVEAYIEQTKDDLEKEYEQFQQDEKSKQYNYSSSAEYAKDYRGLDLDDQGNVISTYNQQSLYDWYVVGGRWDGELTQNRQFSEGGFNFGDRHHTVNNNSISVAQLLSQLKKAENPDENKDENKDDNDNDEHDEHENEDKGIDKYVYSTIIDIDGKLHQSKEFGWWGSYTETCDKNQWLETYKNILERSKEDYLVSLDCHI